MLQAGRIVNVHLPKDRVTQNHQGYGFVEFISEEDAEYAARIMNQVRLYGKPIRVNKVSWLCDISYYAQISFVIGGVIRYTIRHVTRDHMLTLPRPPQISRRPSKSELSSSSATWTPSSTRRPSTTHSRASARSSRRQRSPATRPGSPRATASSPTPPSRPPTTPSPT